MKKILAKAIYAVFGKSIEAERRHCVEMQNALNEEHHKRLGWYVTPDHRLIVEKQGVVLW